MWFGKAPIVWIEWATILSILGAIVAGCTGHPRAFVGLLIAAGVGGALVWTVILVAANRP